MVAIKDFGIPSCCVNCDMCTSDNPLPKDENRGYCHVTQKSITNIYDEKPSDCPLVEIEPLTDSEQRIFLSAMSRKERICKELDSEKVDDSTVKKLVPIVNSIKRKVKKTLWN